MPKSVSLKALAISNGALKEDELPSRIKVLDWGTNKTLDGEILFDSESAGQFYENQRAIGRTMAPLDFNHNTVAGTKAYDAKDDDEKEPDEDDKKNGKKGKMKGKMKAECTYADLANSKYPIDTEEHVRAAWSYIHMARNQKGYSVDEISAIKHKIADK